MKRETVKSIMNWALLIVSVMFVVYMVLPLALGIGLDILWDYWGFWR